MRVEVFQANNATALQKKMHDFALKNPTIIVAVQSQSSVLLPASKEKAGESNDNIVTTITVTIFFK